MDSHSVITRAKALGCSSGIMCPAPSALTIWAPGVRAALTEALTRLPPGEAAAEVSKALNLPRKPLYKRALEMQGR